MHTHIYTHIHIYIYVRIHTHTHTHTHIYIYVFTNLISTSIQGTRKKKPWPGTRDKSISNHRPGKKRKKFASKSKKRPTSSDSLKKIKGYTVSGQKRNQKTLRESCNATITKVLNTSGANYKINLNRESKIFN